MPTKTRSSNVSHFINVDFEIRSATNLHPLVAALGKRVSVLFDARHKRTYYACLEIAGMAKDADSTIRKFCGLIDSLPPAQRKLWKTAKARDFNIGIQAENQPYCSVFLLSAETVRTVSSLGGCILFTVYAPDSTSPVSAEN